MIFDKKLYTIFIIPCLVLVSIFAIQYDFEKKILQDGIPIRVAAIHFLNPPRIFWTIYQIIIRLCKQKIRDRIHLHGSIDSLHNYLRKTILPKSLNGDVCDSEADDKDSFDRFFKENRSYDGKFFLSFGIESVEQKSTELEHR